jgi:hypothetical protein
MKNFIISLVSVFIVLSMTGCLGDSDSKEQYSALGNYYIISDSAIIETDDDKRILINNTSKIPSSVSDSDRIIIYFTLADGYTPRGIDYLADIVSMGKVAVSDIVELKKAVSDTIGDDNICINSLWIAHNYLNLNFSFYGGYANHYIYLACDSGNIPVDTVNVEIRHNANSDGGITYYYGFTSFDLSSVKNTQADSVILHIKASVLDGTTFYQNLTYKY